MTKLSSIRYFGDCPRCGMPMHGKERKCPVCPDCRSTMKTHELDAWRKPVAA